MPQLIVKKTDQLSELAGVGTAAVLNVPAAGDALPGEVVRGDDSRMSNRRDWLAVDLTNQTATNHTSATLDLGVDLPVRQAIRYKQTGDSQWRFAVVMDSVAGVLTLMGEPAVAGVALAEIESGRASIHCFIFSAGINEVTADLWVAEHSAGAFDWPGEQVRVIGLEHILGTADALSGGGLNATINGGADVFSTDAVMDSIKVNTGVTCQHANNLLSPDDTLQLKCSAPGQGDQAGLKVWVVVVPDED